MWTVCRVLLADVNCMQSATGRCELYAECYWQILTMRSPFFFFQANLLYITSLQYGLPFVALGDADLYFLFNHKPSTTLTGPHFCDCQAGS
jgi:hypothetical protein